MSRPPKAAGCWYKGRVRSFHKKLIRKKVRTWNPTPEKRIWNRENYFSWFLSLASELHNLVRKLSKMSDLMWATIN